MEVQPSVNTNTHHCLATVWFFFQVELKLELAGAKLTVVWLFKASWGEQNTNVDTHSVGSSQNALTLLEQ